jgi:hypothetical protein
VGGFYKTLGQDIGDLVYNTGGVGFWWNTDTCANPPTGSNTRYISINNDGSLRPESNLGSGVKFFPKVFTQYHEFPVPSDTGISKTYNITTTLGVLLIFGP